MYLIGIDHRMSSVESMLRMGMPADTSWSARDLFLTFAMWTVMMIGMMAPTALPVMLLFNRMRAGTNPGHSSGAAALFGMGHLIIWVSFSALAASLQWTLHHVAILSPHMSVTSPRLAGAILIAAGLYQLTPAKAKCLTKCQSPLGFLVTNWKEGGKGVLELGLRHGAYCLGCCWALMCVLFVVGVMNLAWVAALTAFVFLEKFGPTGMRVAQAGGAVMILAGLLSMATRS